MSTISTTHAFRNTLSHGVSAVETGENVDQTMWTRETASHHCGAEFGCAPTAIYLTPPAFPWPKGPWVFSNKHELVRVPRSSVVAVQASLGLASLDATLAGLPRNARIRTPCVDLPTDLVEEALTAANVFQVLAIAISSGSDDLVQACVNYVHFEMRDPGKLAEAIDIPSKPALSHDQVRRLLQTYVPKSPVRASGSMYWTRWQNYETWMSQYNLSFAGSPEQATLIFMAIVAIPHAAAAAGFREPLEDMLATCGVAMGFAPEYLQMCFADHHAGQARRNQPQTLQTPSEFLRQKNRLKPMLLSITSGYLDLASLGVAETVCREWKKISREASPLWKSLLAGIGVASESEANAWAQRKTFIAWRPPTRALVNHGFTRSSGTFYQVDNEFNGVDAAYLHGFGHIFFCRKVQAAGDLVQVEIAEANTDASTAPVLVATYRQSGDKYIRVTCVTNGYSSSDAAKPSERFDDCLLRQGFVRQADGVITSRNVILAPDDGALAAFLVVRQGGYWDLHAHLSAMRAAG